MCVCLADWPLCGKPMEPTICNGHRCSLGECIPEDRVCDRKFDCPDGSDESDDLCRMAGKCAPDELRCKDGSCIQLIKFCDGNADCKDSSDEPTNCTCFDYLT